MASKNKRSEKQQPRPFLDGLRHWLPRITGGVLLLVVIVFAGERLTAKLIDPQAMKIKSVQVEGMFEHVKPLEVKQVAASFSEQGFLGVDVGHVKLAIEALPWVRQASVRRVWPDTLYVSLEERTAAARWGDAGLVSPDGALFFPQDITQFAQLPVLIGPGSNGALVLAQYRKIRGLLAAHDLVIAQIEQDERRAWIVTLSSGMKLLLGRKESAIRLARFIDIYPKVLMTWERTIDEVDLRYTNGFAVRWNAVTGKENEIAQG